MTPAPIYTFIVNNIDYSVIYSQPLPSSIENIIDGLNNQGVYVPYVNKPLKNGDVFTLYGKRAEFVYNTFIGKYPKVLDLFAKTDYIPTLITKRLEFDKLSLPPKSPNSKNYVSVLLNCSDKDATFVLSSFDANNEPVNISISCNGIQNINSPSSSFVLNLNSGSKLVLNLESAEKFYFTYNNLDFNC